MSSDNESLTKGKLLKFYYAFFGWNFWIQSYDFTNYLKQIKKFNNFLKQSLEISSTTKREKLKLKEKEI